VKPDLGLVDVDGVAINDAGLADDVGHCSRYGHEED
jgi:hypothetical protein